MVATTATVPATTSTNGRADLVRVGPRASLNPVTVGSGGRHGIAVFASPGSDRVRAVDNRCPHMGFPLHRGSVCDGILTCHWHHARFDLASGGTLAQWAADVPAYPVEVRDGEVFVDVVPRRDERAHRERRLHDGLERNL